MWLVTLVKFRYNTYYQRGAFPLSCCPRAGTEGLNEIHTASGGENIELLQSHIATYRKTLKEVLFLEEKFLYKKITKKDVYMNYGATADIPEDAVKQYRYLTALK